MSDCEFDPAIAEEMADRWVLLEMLARMLSVRDHKAFRLAIADAKATELRLLRSAAPRSGTPDVQVVAGSSSAPWVFPRGPVKFNPPAQTSAQSGGVSATREGAVGAGRDDVVPSPGDNLVGTPPATSGSDTRVRPSNGASAVMGSEPDAGGHGSVMEQDGDDRRQGSLPERGPDTDTLGLRPAGTKPAQTQRRHRTFTDQQKREAVHLAGLAGKIVARREFDIHASVLDRWIHQFPADFKNGEATVARARPDASQADDDPEPGDGLAEAAAAEIKAAQDALLAELEQEQARPISRPPTTAPMTRAPFDPEAVRRRAAEGV